MAAGQVQFRRALFNRFTANLDDHSDNLCPSLHLHYRDFSATVVVTTSGYLLTGNKFWPMTGTPGRGPTRQNLPHPSERNKTQKGYNKIQNK